MLKPLGDRIIIEVVKVEEKSAFGIVLPDSAKEKPQEGKVVAVGTGFVTNSGSIVPLAVKEGDYVIYAPYSGTEVKYNGSEFLIIREADILAIVE
ncbi:co-chaperone GroES [Kurthia sibirica]|uniref:Co-chaperonin GroES n=1 Tax=Kurthia sibirica TaxID=202750 RepID=A0A2U3AJ46_9BACL|nr:co-chaperone GroES [Kurthia sibirica]PWI24560.1 co-chaperone GroES [Kurthia sibirica]GEK33511.1 10 kDa chaperonin [Kurthia sibirica]